MAKLTDLAIDECRKLFEAGDPKALLEAIDFCARSGSAMPLWLAEAFCARFDKWSRYEVKTLDQAFGVERKGERISNRKHREWLKPRVAWEVSRLHRQEKLPIDEALFERVGEILKIPMGTARDIYYKDNRWRQLFDAIPLDRYSE
jgi:hypothetical protein